EAVCDRDELVARLDDVGAEAALEDAPHRGHERRAAGEEYPVDFGRGERGRGEHLVERLLDRLQLGCDPRLELGARDGIADLEARPAEMELGGGVARERFLGVRNR